MYADHFGSEGTITGSLIRPFDFVPPVPSYPHLLVLAIASAAVKLNDYHTVIPFVLTSRQKPHLGETD
jgi:hypothetical protein